LFVSVSQSVETNVQSILVYSKARGYVYAKIEYVSIRAYLSKIEYAYDTFRTLNSIHPADLYVCLPVYSSAAVYRSMTR